MFSHALQHGTIPDCSSLLIRDLPVLTNSHDNKKIHCKIWDTFPRLHTKFDYTFDNIFIFL